MSGGFRLMILLGAFALAACGQSNSQSEFRKEADQKMMLVGYDLGIAREAKGFAVQSADKSWAEHWLKNSVVS